MKKIILTAVMAVMAIGAQAQDWNKGDFFVGAKTTNLGLNMSSWDGYNETTFNLGVEGGYFFADKFAADVNLGVDYFKAKGYDATTTFGFGVGVRYYPVSNLYARVGFDAKKMKDVDMLSYAGVEVGYDFFLNDNVFVTPAVYFKKGLGKAEKGTDDGNHFGLAARFGFRF